MQEARKRGLLGRLVRALWIPVVIVIVLLVAGTVDTRLHGVFGSDRRFSDGGPPLEEPRNLHPKQVLYEIFGPANTTAIINYMDENGDPKRVDVTSLPWSHSFSMKTQTGALNIVAQGDSNYLGCRITVDDRVKDEYVARLPYAQTYCEDKSK